MAESSDPSPLAGLPGTIPAPGLKPSTATPAPPIIGDWVWQYAYGTPGGEYAGGVPRPALVTWVYEPANPQSTLDLTVFTRNGHFCNPETHYGPGEGGHWGWPTRTVPRGETP